MRSPRSDLPPPTPGHVGRLYGFPIESDIACGDDQTHLIDFAQLFSPRPAAIGGVVRLGGFEPVSQSNDGAAADAVHLSSQRTMPAVNGLPLCIPWTWASVSFMAPGRAGVGEHHSAICSRRSR
jgi:hypothetical protein